MTTTAPLPDRTSSRFTRADRLSVIATVARLAAAGEDDPAVLADAAIRGIGLREPDLRDDELAYIGSVIVDLTCTPA